MYEKERPFGAKLIFILLLVGGIVGLFASLFSSDKSVRDIIMNEEIFIILASFFNNITFLRALLLIFSIFTLWLSSAVFSLRKIAWKLLLWYMALYLLMCIIILIIIAVHPNITLGTSQKIVIAFRLIVALLWFCYLVTLKDHFVY
jgi:hypothetical protein